MLRVIEYVGPRNLVEEHLTTHVTPERRFGGATGDAVTIRGATIGTYPEILDTIPDAKTEVEHPEIVAPGGHDWMALAVCPVDHGSYFGKCPACHTRLPGPLKHEGAP